MWKGNEMIDSITDWLYVLIITKKNMLWLADSISLGYLK